MTEQDLRFLIQCVQLGKPSVQLPLEVYLSDGGYKGGVQRWQEQVAFWFEFPKARELLQIFSAYGQLQVGLGNAKVHKYYNRVHIPYTVPGIRQHCDRHLRPGAVLELDIV